MKVIVEKLHVYISLATPHLGTLFADSQLVSTGKRDDSKYFPFSVFISGPFLLRDVGIVSSEEMQSFEGFIFIFLVMALSERPSCIIWTGIGS